MSFPSGLHLHTSWGDGKNTPEEMILTAMGRGFLSVGISEHGYAPYDGDTCIPEGKMGAYRDEIFSLKRKYAGKIEVYAGLEVDAFYLHDKSRWDYVIGSVHYVKSACSGRSYAVDYSPGRFLEAAEDVAGGSVEEMVKGYIKSVAELAESYRPQILGHIDVIAKFNQDGRFFDEEAPWYLDMWEQAIARIAKTGCVVEANSGAVSRGYRAEPYPALPLMRMLRKNNVPVTIGSDAHSSDGIDCAYPRMEELLRRAGYDSVMIMKGGGFVEYSL
jgi:histidinol-phosphatase (PHP family)